MTGPFRLAGICRRFAPSVTSGAGPPVDSDVFRPSGHPADAVVLLYRECNERMNAMKRLSPALPKDLPVCSDLAEAVDACLNAGDDITDRHFLSGALSGSFTSRMEFRRCRFDGVRLSGCRFGRTDFVDVVFADCDLSGAEMSGCGFLRCRFENCKGVGTGFVHSPMRHVSFEGGPFRLANFSETPFKQVAFAGCDLSESTFLQCTAEGLSFDACRLVKINFCRTKLAGLDLSSNELEGILVSGDELRDAIVSPLQAVELARLLGIKIKDGI